MSIIVKGWLMFIVSLSIYVHLQYPTAAQYRRRCNDSTTEESLFKSLAGNIFKVSYYSKNPEETQKTCFTIHSKKLPMKNGVAQASIVFRYKIGNEWTIRNGIIDAKDSKLSVTFDDTPNKADPFELLLVENEILFTFLCTSETSEEILVQEFGQMNSDKVIEEEIKKLNSERKLYKISHESCD